VGRYKVIVSPANSRQFVIRDTVKEDYVFAEDIKSYHFDTKRQAQLWIEENLEQLVTSAKKEINLGDINDTG